MRVLVTGSSGFLGRHAVAALASAGHEVLGVSRSGAHPLGRGVRVVRGDLLASDVIESLVEECRPHAVVHAAWSAAPGTYLTSPENLRWVAATLRLVCAAAEQGVGTFIGVGSSAEYGSSAGPCHELSTPLDPRSLYARCKARTGELVIEAGRALGLRTLWARVFQPFGVGEPAGRLVPYLAEQLTAGQPAHVAHGSNTLDFIDAADVGVALERVLASSLSGPVNIGTGRATTVAQLATQLGVLTGRSDLLVFAPSTDSTGSTDSADSTDSTDSSDSAGSSAESHCLVADASTLLSTGWAPPLSLTEALRQVISFRQTTPDNRPTQAGVAP